MLTLAFAIVLWSGLHMMRGAAPSLRGALIGRIGFGPYRGAFSLAIVASIVLMVLGWRSSVPRAVYAPPAWGADGALVLMLIALTLFAASGVPTNIKRIIRHPQLTGVCTWAAAHLLANGDSRSILLFAGIGAWGIVEMILINRREGAWQKPAAVPMSAEVKPIVGGLVAYAVLFLAHPYLFGVAPR